MINRNVASIYRFVLIDGERIKSEEFVGKKIRWRVLYWHHYFEEDSLFAHWELMCVLRPVT